MQRLSALDNIFLQIESAATPMHVAGLLVFRPPDGASDFAERLGERLRESVCCAAPFDRRLRRPRLSLGRGRWEAVPRFSSGAHVHDAACAAPGGPRELWELVAGLHARVLDLAQPPWECHVVQGLAERRFALYYKIHHAAIDGVSGLRRMQNNLSRTPEETTAPLWQERRAPPRATPRPAPSTVAVVRELVGALRTHVRLRRERGQELPGMFTAPGTSLNRSPTPRRALHTLELDLAAVRAVAAAAGVTLNDVVLALVAGALRQYLAARAELPTRPLVAFVPVSLHDEESSGRPSNRVCNVLVTLPTHLDEARPRLHWVHAEMGRAKQFIRSLSPAASTAFSMLLGAPAVLAQMLGLSGHLPPPFNVVVSNVAGPRQPLYHSGARLEALYPVSALFERQGLNITVVSYLDRLYVGLIGCPDVCAVDDVGAALAASWQALAAA